MPIVLSRRRAQMFWSIGPIERREMFYSRLLSSVEAAKEVRLFGIGAFLRRRMLAERRTANAAKRHLDRRELVVQAGLVGLAAAVAGGGLLWAVGRRRRAGCQSVTSRSSWRRSRVCRGRSRRRHPRRVRRPATRE